MNDRFQIELHFFVPNHAIKLQKTTEVSFGKSCTIIINGCEISKRTSPIVPNYQHLSLSQLT